jgi:hypothetical protein
MKKLLLSIGVMVTFAVGGEYADKLTKCLIYNTTTQDLRVLKKWIFFGFAQDPDLAKYTRITLKDLDQANREVATFFNRLLLKDCREEFRNAIKHEGTSALRIAFQYLGTRAGQEVFHSPYVQQYLKGFGEYLDEKKLEKVLE